MEESFESVANSLAQQLQGLKSADQLDNAARIRMLDMLDTVRKEIEPPSQAVRSMAYGSLALVTARIAVEMGIFDAFKSNGNAVMSLDELDSKTKGDKRLLVRILRVMASRGLMKFVGEDKWQASPIGAMLYSGSVQAAILTHHYPYLKSYGMLLDYLEKTGFQHPDDVRNGPWQYAYTPNQTYFEWLAAGDGRCQAAFNRVMTIHQQFRGQSWFDFFPIKEKLNGTRPEDTVFVDIGGGLGHDSLEFCDKYPAIPGRVVLQDLPHVIDDVVTRGPYPSRFEHQAYDAFTAQSIKAARVYYLRTVLHDWPDSDALKMLKNIHQAMGEDSILLINENVMPVDHIAAHRVDLDFALMSILAGYERTEEQWTQLIEKAGFEMVETWRPTGPQVAPSSLFEARLPR